MLTRALSLRLGHLIFPMRWCFLFLDIVTLLYLLVKLLLLLHFLLHLLNYHIELHIFFNVVFTLLNLVLRMDWLLPIIRGLVPLSSLLLLELLIWVLSVLNFLRMLSSVRDLVEVEFLLSRVEFVIH